MIRRIRRRHARRPPVRRSGVRDGPKADVTYLNNNDEEEARVDSADGRGRCQYVYNDLDGIHYPRCDDAKEWNAEEQSRLLYDVAASRDWDRLEELIPTLKEGRCHLVPYRAFRTRRTLLHEAVDRRAPSNVIRAILAAYSNDNHSTHEKSLACMQDNLGQTALHLAANRRDMMPTGVVQALVDVDSNCLSVKDHILGETALHSLFSLSHDDRDDLYQQRTRQQQFLQEILQSSMETSPFFTLLDHRNRTPLYIACSNKNVSHDIVKLLMDACPRALMIREKEKKWTPLHVACCSNSDCVDKVNALLLSFHNHEKERRCCCCWQDGQGWTPLHVAIATYSSVMVVESLLRWEPNWARIKDDKGMTPLMILNIEHTLCHHQMHREVLWNLPIMVQEFLDTKKRSERSAIEKFCHTDLWPKFHLLVMAMTLGTISQYDTEHDDEYLTTEIRTDSAPSLTKKTFRLLHECLMLGEECPIELTAVALGVHPHQASLCDEHGNWPLSTAIENGVLLTSGRHEDGGIHRLSSTHKIRQAVLDSLVRLNPMAAMVPDSRGKLPFQRFTRHKSGRLEDGMTLLCAHPAALLDQNVTSLVLPYLLSNIHGTRGGTILSFLYSAVKEMPHYILEHVPVPKE